MVSNGLVWYVVIGLAFSLFIEKSNDSLNKDKKDYYMFNWLGRVTLTLIWPIFLCMFVVELIKNLHKR
jgi:cell division protein FtsW (lipid II flippase)